MIIENDRGELKYLWSGNVIGVTGLGLDLRISGIFAHYKQGAFNTA